jgi:transcriptional regulator with XRE-family HTH domain
MNKRKEVIKNNLKEYRIKAGLTQKQVAKLIGVNNEERVCHWEKGNNMPDTINLLRLSNLYKIKPEKIYPELKI